MFFACSSLTSITLPNSVTSIGREAFQYCSSLTSITLPSSVTSIGELVFEGCSSLTQIVVGEGNPIYDSRDNCNAIIETASNTLLYGCQKTIIPHSVTSIGDGAFDGRTSLTSIVLPNSVTSIGEHAFTNCSSLTNFYCYRGKPPYAYIYAFGFSVENATLHVPASAIEEYKSTAPWSKFGTIVALTADEEIQGIDSKKSVPLRIQAHAGEIVIQGAKAGTIVSIHTTNGMKVASGIVGAESMLALPTAIPAGELVIVQVGAQCVKLMMK